MIEIWDHMKSVNTRAAFLFTLWCARFASVGCVLCLFCSRLLCEKNVARCKFKRFDSNRFWNQNNYRQSPKYVIRRCTTSTRHGKKRNSRHLTPREFNSVVTAFFSEMMQRKKPSSLWAQYSMLKSTLKIYDRVDIGKYATLTAMLKRNSHGYETITFQGK